MSAAPGTASVDLPRASARHAGLTAFARSRIAAIPLAAWVCALAALANGLTWSLIMPPFQVPDENAHYAYVAKLAETGSLPRPVSPEPALPPRQQDLMAAMLAFGIVGRSQNPAPLENIQETGIERVEAQHLSATAPGDALSATNNPPLYYLLEAALYKLTPSEGVLDKLAVMRCLSALMGALTVLVVFLFLMELLPATPWAWTAGALMVAFEPLFAQISGGVNNDNLLYLMSALTLLGLARCFRRGLNVRNGGLLGGALGLGIVSKLTILGFVPGVILAVLILVGRELPRPSRAALGGAATAVGCAAAPVLLYILLNHFVWHRAFIPGGVGETASQSGHGRPFSLREEISHIWQLYLPRLWLTPQFTAYPLWSTWFVGFVGHFGWLDYGFPNWVYQVARVVALAVIALALLECVRHSARLRKRLPELAVYVALAVGLCVEIGIQSYRYLIATGGVFEQARYLLPLLGLYAALIALAVRFGGRRWGPVLAVVLVMLGLGHDLYAQAVTIARYYA